jgi:FkbM family methyltransferase
MKITRKIALLLRKIGLEGIVTYCIESLHMNSLNRKAKKEDWVNNPTNEMQESKNYFEEHLNDIETVINFLSDEKSKSVYLKAIRYRYTYNKSDLPDYNNKDQYFPSDIVKLNTNEVFVDCGAYKGDTLHSFLKLTNKAFKKYIAFEADSYNYKFITKRYRKYNNIFIYDKAVWNKEEPLKFIQDGSPGSEISENGDTVVDGVAIDSIPECVDATFIKMDVEGAEMKALEGAKKTISTNLPKLAICIYHSDEDMIYIPKWLHENYPNYKIYIRHHCYMPIETVVYAIP